MSDLISRQEAIDAYILHTTDYLVGEKPRRAFTEVLRELPSALVTCANCRHCEHRNNDEPYCHHHAMVVSPDYFCADGEEGEWMP